MAREELLCGPAAERGADLVLHLFLGGDVALLGEVPGGTESLSARHDGDLDKRVGVAEEP